MFMDLWLSEHRNDRHSASGFLSPEEYASFCMRNDSASYERDDFCLQRPANSTGKFGVDTFDWADAYDSDDDFEGKKQAKLGKARMGFAVRRKVKANSEEYDKSHAVDQDDIRAQHEQQLRDLWNEEHRNDRHSASGFTSPEDYIRTMRNLSAGADQGAGQGRFQLLRPADQVAVFGRDSTSWADAYDDDFESASNRKLAAARLLLQPRKVCFTQETAKASPPSPILQLEELKHQLVALESFVRSQAGKAESEVQLPVQFSHRADKKQAKPAAPTQEPKSQVAQQKKRRTRRPDWVHK
jgi:hypothetical protein